MWKFFFIEIISAEQQSTFIDTGLKLKLSIKYSNILLNVSKFSFLITIYLYEFYIIFLVII